MTVPLAEPLRYLYPLTPTSRVEDGAREIRFDPPEERLAGLRLHEWIGARQAVGRASSDLERIGRQQVFVAALLREGIRPPSSMADDPLVDTSSRAALEEIAAVSAGWRMECLDGVRNEVIDGQKVLVRDPPTRRVLAAAHRSTLATARRGAAAVRSRL